MGEALEESAGEALGAEHLGPFVEGQIGGDQGRAPLVALAEHLEQELGAGLGQRHEAEFVDDQPDGMHFIVEGEVEIELTPTPQRLRDGEYYGEIAIIKEVPRRVTVTAVTECRLLILGVRDFRNLLNESPDLREEFTRVAEERLSGIDGEGAENA